MRQKEDRLVSITEHSLTYILSLRVYLKPDLSSGFTDNANLKENFPVTKFSFAIHHQMVSLSRYKRQ